MRLNADAVGGEADGAATGFAKRCGDGVIGGVLEGSALHVMPFDTSNVKNKPMPTNASRPACDVG